MSSEIQEKAAPAASDAGEKPNAAARQAVKSAVKSAVKPSVKPTAKTAGAKTAPAVKKAPAKKAAGKKAAATKKSAAQVKAVNKPAAPAEKPAKPASKPAAKEKVKKAKLVRDSFTMPENEYQVLGDVKKAFLKIGISVKKSELLRAGVALIKAMEIGNLKTVIDGLPPIKAGRPKKEK
jgi:hypothetical protein